MTERKQHYYNDRTLRGCCGRTGKRTRLISGTTCWPCLQHLELLLAEQMARVRPVQPEAVR